jgi:hypothetical protein
MRGPRIGHDERTYVLGLLTGAQTAGLLTLDEYDARVTHVGTATYASELADQLTGLPEPYVWDVPAEPPPTPSSGRAALILGIASVPMSLCVIGGLLGLLAVIASRHARVPGGPRITAGFVGRISGIIGIVLSIGALAAVVYVRNAQLGP